MNTITNTQDKEKSNAYTCIPVGEYLTYFEEKGKHLTPSILYKTMTDKEVKSRDEVTAFLATLTSTQEAEIRVEGQFYLDHLPTAIIPSKLTILSYSTYNVGHDHILTIQAKCEESQPIIASDNDLERHPELTTIFHATQQTDYTLE